MNVATADLISLNLDDGSEGHEQRGVRRAVVLKTLKEGRFIVLVVAPTTSKIANFPLNHPYYPRLPKGTGSKPPQGSEPGFPGLDLDSVVLLDHVRSVDPDDPERQVVIVGRLSPQVFLPILSNFAVMMGLIKKPGL